ncbi:LytTR family transcriptional regulator [Levilactobacillus bambusae]|uniref:LytTR family transcriptional regulator n=1 Tax=Levilactobacillus bambusae TaxID=2024736 RepID=A0A2V1MXE0_9LACO|nr:LytTR family transcriptional regulator [Levilactobacillus bambusae]
MKIRVEVDSQLNDKEVVIRVPNRDAEVVELMAAIEQLAAKHQTLPVTKRGTQLQLPLADVLFFETENRLVYAHTGADSYVTRKRLYELETDLPVNFLRISKSAILNVEQVYTLTHSVTGNLVQFKQSHKQIYVSRRYYKALKAALE